MKLAEATGFARLRDDGLQIRRQSNEIKSALELARDIFAEAEDREQPFLFHTPDTWARKWLPSRRFRLVRMPLNAAAMPCEPKVDNLVLKKIHAMETKPIVVDYNKNQVGRTMHGFAPQTIVIDGKHRFKAATLRGETHIMAWVGEVALETMHGMGGGGPAPERTTPAPGAQLTAGGPGSGRRPEGGIGSKEDYRKWEEQGGKERTPIKAPYGEYGRRLNARGSEQDAKLAQRSDVTYAEGKELKTLNVKKKVEAGGPGSGRRPEGGPAEHKAAAKSLMEMHEGNKKKAIAFADKSSKVAKKFGDEKLAAYWDNVKSVLSRPSRGPGSRGGATWSYERIGQ